jgi:hypothetical protein
MDRVFPQEIEKYLDYRYSHLISRIDHPDLPGRIRQYLEKRGITITQESTFADETDVGWAVFSFKGESARPLVLDLIESGFPESIRGIDAQHF